MLKKMKSNKKGFTLAELLIVIAILGVLVAVAVPVFSSQLEKAKVQVDSATARSAISLAQADFLMENRKPATGATTITYYFNATKGENGQQIVIAKDGAGLATTGDAEPESSELKKNKPVLKVIVKEDGSVDMANSGWTARAG